MEELRDDPSQVVIGQRDTEEPHGGERTGNPCKQQGRDSGDSAGAKRELFGVGPIPPSIWYVSPLTSTSAVADG